MYSKKLLDEYYDQSENFRLENPGYKKWEGNYDDYHK